MTPEPPPMTNHPIEPHAALERCAKAIAARHIQFGAEDAVGKVMLEHSWRNHLHEARAALVALRDLPEDVIAAGEFAASLFSHNQVMSSLNGEPVEDASGQLPEVFTAMINTIIGESA